MFGQEIAQVPRSGGLRQLLATTWKVQQDMIALVPGDTLPPEQITADTNSLFTAAQSYATAHGGPFYDDSGPTPIT